MLKNKFTVSFLIISRTEI